MAAERQDGELGWRLRELFALLRCLAPDPDRQDVAWSGLWFIPRPKRWYPASFALYRGQLFCFLEVGWMSLFELHWRVGTDEVELPPARSWEPPLDNDAELWTRVLDQLRRRLRWGIENPGRFRRHVERHLPLECRTGRIRRRHLWPEGTEALLPPGELAAFERAVEGPPAGVPRPAMTRARFLDDAAIAYAAAFPELAGLPPAQRYRRRADTRHGGLLDLDEHDADGFREWFDSGRWAGSHPWEIVFGHPHGIHLYPLHDAQTGWTCSLAVSTEALYVACARMAVALEAAAVPFTVHEGGAVLAALRGEDDIEVGPRYPAIQLDEVRELRPDAVARVGWNPLPRFEPASGDHGTVRAEDPMPDSIQVQGVVPATPDEVYDAWLDATQHSAMTGGEATSDPRPGGAFTAWDGYIMGTWDLLERGRRIVARWRSTEFPPGAPDSRLEVRLEPSRDGTRVTILHQDIPSGQGRRYEEGWVTYYLEPMAVHFAGGARIA